MWIASMQAERLIDGFECRPGAVLALLERDSLRFRPTPYTCSRAFSREMSQPFGIENVVIHFLPHVYSLSRPPRFVIGCVFVCSN